MMNLKDLPDVNFVEVNSSEVEAAVFASYKNYTGRDLAKGDPVRLFLLVIADLLVQLKHEINYTGKQNLLKYATGNNLDHLGALVMTERLPATAAKTTIKTTLSAVQARETIIPAGTRVSTSDKMVFSLDEDVIIPSGELEGIGEATCTTVGTEGNGYVPGEINQIVDYLPYVDKMVNTTTSENGSSVEEDEAYRKRIQEAPERFSTAGPVGAYRYYALSASPLVVDATITTPSPGVVDVRPLLSGGELPGEEMLKLVEKTLSSAMTRPLTDKVQVTSPDRVSYDISVKYWISTEQSGAAKTIQKAVNDKVKEYILWQKSVLGRDVNPSKLMSYLMAAGIKRAEITSPVYTTVENTAVAIENTVNVTMEEAEDE